MWDSGSPRALGTRLGTFDSCHPDHFGDLRLIAEALSDFGTTLVVVVAQELPIWRVNQSRYWVVLLRLTLLFGVRCKSYALLHFITM